MKKALCQSVVVFSVMLFALSVARADNIDIFNDFQSGQQYFLELIITADAVNTTLALGLSPAAVTDLNAAENLFAIGLTFVDVIPDQDEWVQFGNGSLLLNGISAIPSSNSGTYREDGDHNPADQSAKIGKINGEIHNAFYLFDISGFSEPVTSATFNLFVKSIGSPVPSLAFAGYDVSTDPSVLAAPVPEPATMLLFSAGLAGLAAIGRRRKV